jgi:hypothetical protein
MLSLSYFNSASGEPNVLDLVLGDQSSSRLVTSCKVGSDIGADHLPVITTIRVHAQGPASQEKVEIIDKKKMASLISSEFENLEMSLNTKEDVDTFINRIESIFKDAKQKSKSQKKKRKRKLPPDILEWIRFRKDLMAKRTKASTEQERRNLSQQYNQANHKVKFLIQEFDKREIEYLATKVCQEKDTSKMWHLVNEFKRLNCETKKASLPIVKEDGSLTESDLEKGYEFSRHLRSVHQTPENPLFDQLFKKQIDDQIRVLEQENSNVGWTGEKTKTLDLKSFHLILDSTKAKSSPGEDEISYEVLKLCSEKVLKKICQLMNVCQKLGYFPSAWKNEKVVMIDKKTGTNQIDPFHFCLALEKSLSITFVMSCHSNFRTKTF